jgi:Flp pilus assembly secretin CpaC
MRRLLILLPLLLVLASLSARAEDQLDVTWRQARIVPLQKPATSVIIGDPTVADVTLDDPTTMVVFGKAPGETNIVVLSGSHETLLSYSLVVSPTTSGHVTVLNASSDPAPVEVLYSCGQGRCTRVLSPSDIAFSATSTSSSSSSSNATKSASSSSEPTVPGSFLIVPQSAPAPAQTTTPAQ